MYECDQRDSDFGVCVGSSEGHEMCQFLEFERGRYVRTHLKLNPNYIKPERLNKSEGAEVIQSATRRTREHEKRQWRMSQGEGQERKAEGIGQVLDNTPQWYKDGFRARVDTLIEQGDPFTSEDVTIVVGFPSDARKIEPETPEAKAANNGVGAMMNALARKGVIVKVGTRSLAERPNQHAAELNLWQGATAPVKVPLMDFG